MPGYFIARLNAGLTSLIASSYFGSSINDIALDISQNLYVVGVNESSGSIYEVTLNTGTDLYSPLGTNAYVAKVDKGLTRILAALTLGGMGYDGATNVAVANNGNIYISGYTESPDFPILNGKYGGAGDTFLTVLNSGLTTLVHSTYLGGAGKDAPIALAIAVNGAVYVAGSTGSSNFPTSGGAYQMTSTSPTDSYITILAPDISIGNPVPNIRLKGGGSDLGSGAGSDTVYVYNIGSDNLRIDNIVLSKYPNHFNLNVNGGDRPCGGSVIISPGNYCTVVVSHIADKTADVRYGTDVVFNTNDPDTPAAAVHFSGSGSTVDFSSYFPDQGGGCNLSNGSKNSNLKGIIGTYGPLLILLVWLMVLRSWKGKRKKF
jgi:hypothetical protein